MSSGTGSIPMASSVGIPVTKLYNTSIPYGWPGAKG
jgi:hypothetical protein